MKRRQHPDRFILHPSSFILGLVAACTMPPMRARVDVAEMDAEVNEVNVGPVTADVTVDADMTAALARIEKLEASLARIDKLEAELNIGGEGDSIVSWIAVGGIVIVAVTAPLGGLFY